jgi:alpha-L-arabinofuranosidase
VIAGQDSLYASATTDAASNELIIKLVNVSDRQQTNTLLLEGIKKLGQVAKLIVLQDNDLTRVNSFDEPMLVSPKESTITIKSKKFDYTSAPHSLTILRIKMN